MPAGPGKFPGVPFHTATMTYDKAAECMKKYVDTSKNKSYGCNKVSYFYYTEELLKRNCESNGILESQIIALIKSKLGT